jgi:hypothetical protein
VSWLPCPCLPPSFTAAAVSAAAESDQGCTQAYSSMYPGPNGKTTGEGHLTHGESRQGPSEMPTCAQAPFRLRATGSGHRGEHTSGRPAAWPKCDTNTASYNYVHCSSA